jgi:ADP-ribose pyrophosphatase YjhB (NUDIX family)
MQLKNLIIKLAFQAKNFITSLTTRTVFGVRCIVIKDDKFLLVKHTYMDGWYHIGGGVDMGESPLQAITRELKEEAGITCLTPPKLYNIYIYKDEKKSEQHYITLYICNDFEEENYICPVEIAEKKWFKLTELPEDTTPATRARILEYIGKAKITDKWK